MKIICPFCHAVLDSKDDCPTVVNTALGTTYVCHKVFCDNADKHPDHNRVAVVFKEQKDEIQINEQKSAV